MSIYYDVSQLTEEKKRELYSCAKLLNLQWQYEHDDPAALLLAIDFCAAMSIPLPHWVAEAYRTRLKSWLEFEVKELSEAFDVSWPKGKSFAASQKRRKFGLNPHSVYSAVQVYVRVEQRAVDNELFELVARDFATNRDVIGKLYALGKKLRNH